MVPDQSRSGLAAWLRPPPLGDPQQARIAATVHTLSLAFVVVALAWAVAGLLLMPQPEYVTPLSFGMASIYFATFLLSHAGRPRAAAWLFILGGWGMTTVAVGLSGGIEAPGLGVYLVLIIAAGLLVGVAAALAVAACSAITTLVFTLAHGSPLLAPVIETSPWSELGVHLTFIVAAAGLLWDALGRIDLAMERTARSEARLRAVFDQASDGIVIMDRDGFVLEANEPVARISGYGRDGITGMRIDDFMTGRELEDSHALLRAMQPGVTYTRERRLRLAEGREIDVENASSVLDDGRVLVIVRDITDRRRAEEMNERLRTALDAAEEGVVLFDTRPGLVYANPAFVRLNAEGGRVAPGLAPEEVAGGPEARGLIAQAQRDLAAGRNFSGQFDRVLPDGSRAVRHATIAHVRDATGEVVGYVGVLRDVTREVELEESLQLTRKLETVGKLAGGLAHDFNNLLTVILGRAEALRATTPSEDVDEILEAGQRAAAITTKLLAFSRNQAVHARRVDLNELVRESVGMLRRLVRESVEVELDLDDEPLWVEADPSQLQQVLVNLAANSRDAMPGGGTLRVSTREIGETEARRPDVADLPDGPLAELGVRDTGEGMEPGVLERLFEPFFTTKEQGRGTGLGLASVREIVRQSGGAITVESGPGQGTLVRVFLPRAEAARAPVVTEAHAAPTRRTRRGRVLIVEDEATLRRLVQRALEAHGHSVLTAHDGPEALRLALADPPDLLVTDVILPGLDGGRLTERLREEHPTLPVLLTSGYAPEDVAHPIHEDERTTFLAKPFTLEQLVDAVERLLEPEKDPEAE